MPQEPRHPGVLPTDRVSKQETVVLVRSLLVDWNILEHMRDHGVGAE